MPQMAFGKLSMRTFILVFLTIVIGTSEAYSQWIKQSVNTTASLRGLSVVSDKVVWASGTGGTFLKTADGGTTWKVGTVPGAEKLDFRDIEAFDASTAYILSIGNGEDSRIYKTIDGGETWDLEFKNNNERAFFDAIACMTKGHCVAMSDPVEGAFLVIVRDSNAYFNKPPNDALWKPQRPGRTVLPGTKEGEAAFAASGTCLITNGFDEFIVSGGSEARVFRHDLLADTWSVVTTPFVKGSAGSGIFSIAMHGINNGVIVGGNYEKPDEAKDNLAFTSNGGVTWVAATGLSGYRSGVTYVDKKTIIAVGTNGSDMSTDGGKNWRKVGSENLNAVAAKGKKSVWAVGPNGLVVKMK